MNAMTPANTTPLPARTVANGMLPIDSMNVIAVMSGATRGFSSHTNDSGSRSPLLVRNSFFQNQDGTSTATNPVATATLPRSARPMWWVSRALSTKAWI